MGCNQGYLQNDQLIVGGKTLEYSDRVADYIVNIYSSDFIGYNKICTGVFVAKNAILTAKHCVGDNYTDLSATFRTSSYDKNSKVVNLTISGFKPVLVPWGVRDDLVILNFSENFPESAKIAKISSLERVVPQSKITVAGYGVYNTNRLDLTTDYMFDDKARYKTIDVSSIEDHDGYFLIDQKLAQGGVCEGDSGGPAYFIDAKTKVMNLVGIASAVGKNCLDQSYFIKTDFLIGKNLEEDL